MTGVRIIADLTRLIYSSQPFGYDDAMLAGILLDARRNNMRDGVTGALVCRQDVYLQLLEGPKTAVRSAYARIKRDDRHLDVRLRLSEAAADRMFADWAMLHDPARSWIWTPEEIADDVLDRASAAEFRNLFATLAANTAQSSPT